MLWELLTGRCAFGGDTLYATAFARLNQEVPPPGAVVDGVPAELDEIVVRATRIDPSERYRTGGELDAVLRTVTGPRPFEITRGLRFEGPVSDGSAAG